MDVRNPAWLILRRADGGRRDIELRRSMWGFLKRLKRQRHHHYSLTTTIWKKWKCCAAISVLSARRAGENTSMKKSAFAEIGDVYSDLAPKACYLSLRVINIVWWIPSTSGGGSVTSRGWPASLAN